MKKNFLLAFALLATLPAFADLEGDGYYRIQNFLTDRWAVMVNNKAKIDQTVTDVDLSSIQLNKDFDEVCYDPGSILYISNHGGSSYNISAQGTSVYDLMNQYVTIAKQKTAQGQQLYSASGKYEGYTGYLGDGNYGSDYFLEKQFGTMQVVTGGMNNACMWYILPVSTSGPNYFGILPTVSTKVDKGENYYTTLYTSFPYSASAAAAGMQFFYIRGMYNGAVEMVEIKNTVPANTPVIVKCAGETPADNKVNIGGVADALKNNNLNGVFFCDPEHFSPNYVEYDPETMRVLGVCSDGSLGFITASNLKYIPANSAYIKVDKGSKAEFICQNPADFAAGVDTIGVSSVALNYRNGVVYADHQIELSVFNMAGQLLVKEVTESLDLNDLGKGVYIVSAPGYKTLKVVK